ncbi:glycoside hydrolase family 43 protein [Asticcacaulis sp. 201]|uniref:glycoside hydrolase family 43 protein n=1 Tax=Asticcacaulis sp. 201 TaxID=3028787 RepID=UPI002916E961|nr:glycoside hydrolase family 43 protein [Asticcacaulis sp. 201]MDV6329723.1 glycoside hydrolase family 43 protein [Asticcacaulis sp. 201]
MFKSLKRKALCGVIAVFAGISSGASAANPIVAGWYADPEIRIYGDQYWIFPTWSADADAPMPPTHFSPAQIQQRANPKIWSPFLRQTFLDAFSSPDLVHWQKHADVLDVENIGWASFALWAPSSVEKDGKYYLFFGANDVHEGEVGGIGVAVADQPQGPFRDLIGKPLIGGIHNGAQPIDQMVFRDDDGQYYMYYGGWKHCNVVKLSADFKSLVPLPDGDMYKEITPDPDYVEGSFMIKRKGIYYLMWSEGDWTGPDYSVAYAMSRSPFGPFKREGKILQQDTTIARGAGHHSVVNIPGTDDWYIVYHRRPLDTNDGNHRQLAIDHMYFDDSGHIKPVVMTNEGVSPRPLK